jgi:hypothetical protein
MMLMLLAQQPDKRHAVRGEMLMSLNDSPPDKAAARAELERRTVIFITEWWSNHSAQAA